MSTTLPVVEALNGDVFRLVVAPAVTTFVTVLVRKGARAATSRRSSLLDRETLNVGFDLTLVAALSAITVVAERARDEQQRVEGLRAAADRGDLAAVKGLATNPASVDAILTPLFFAAVAVVVALALAAVVRNYGYDRLPHRKPRLRMVRGVLLPLFVGVGMLAVVLAVAK